MCAVFGLWETLLNSPKNMCPLPAQRQARTQKSQTWAIKVMSHGCLQLCRQTDVANEADREKRGWMNELTSSRKFPDTHGWKWKDKIDVCLSANSLSAQKKWAMQQQRISRILNGRVHFFFFLFVGKGEGGIAARLQGHTCSRRIPTGVGGTRKKRGSGPMQLSILCPTPGARQGKVR